VTARTRTAVALLAALFALLTAGCDALQDKADQISGEALVNAVRTEIQRRLSDAGVRLEGDLDCTSDKDIDAGSLSGVVSVDCTGTAEGGEKAVAVFNGSVSRDGCTGTLNVTVGAREVYNDKTGNLCGGN
jgi:hypothetical protein